MTLKDITCTEDLPNYKPDLPVFFRWMSLFFLRLAGWRIEGCEPNVPKYVVVGAPHTSNRDGWYLVLTGWYLRTKVDWMVKAELAKGVIGWIICRVGALPIERGGNLNVVQQVAAEYNRRERMALVISPEGTRRKADYWKTGFYWIAVEANVPILFARLDYGRKTVNITGPMLTPTGDLEHDMALIWKEFEGVQGRYPDKVSDMKLDPNSKR